MLSFPGQWEWIVIVALGLLLFGRRLPEIARTMGKTVTEFRNAVAGVGEELHAPAPRTATRSPGAPLPSSNARAAMERTPPAAQREQAVAASTETRA